MSSTGPRILSGREAGQDLLSRIGAKVSDLVARGERPPHLVVVQVGNHPASGPYIRQKEKAAIGCGFRFTHAHLSAKSPADELRRQILAQVRDPEVDGVILQLPLDSETVKGAREADELLHLIPPEKDADGLHPLNQGFLFTNESSATDAISKHPLPATALGSVRLLQHYGLEVSGKRVVVVGKSRLVGAPVASLLLNMGATVTICHRKTKDLAFHTRQAEILVVCAGRQHLVTADHVSPGVVIVDVGIHVQADGKLTGDVHPDARALASAYSPVPGGVGPMTVAGLIENTLNLRLRHASPAQVKNP